MSDPEELRPGESVWVHMLAGAAAGTAEHCGMFPVDTIKVRVALITSAIVNVIVDNTQTDDDQTSMQAHGSAFNTIRETASFIATKKGAIGFFRGISALALGAGEYIITSPPLQSIICDQYFLGTSHQEMSLVTRQYYRCF